MPQKAEWGGMGASGPPTLPWGEGGGNGVDGGLGNPSDCRFFPGKSGGTARFAHSQAMRRNLPSQGEGRNGDGKRRGGENAMVIRPMTAAYALGELGRPAKSGGGKSGPAALFSNAGDSVSFGGSSASAGLYSAKPAFKIMGAVELMSDDTDFLDQQSGFGDTSFII